MPVRRVHCASERATAVEHPIHSRGSRARSPTVHILLGTGRGFLRSLRLIRCTRCGATVPPPLRTFHRVEARWEHSDASAVRWGRKVWAWLRAREHPDEVLCSRLRKAETITVHHPTAVSEDVTRAGWSAFLSRGRRRHWPWFLMNLVGAPLSVVLAPLPGPNLIGYWFVYRAFHHGLILVGLRRVRRGLIPVSVVPEPRLDGDPVRHLAENGCDPAWLSRFLTKHRLPAPVATPTRPSGD